MNLKDNRCIIPKCPFSYIDNISLTENEQLNYQRRNISYVKTFLSKI